MRNKPNKGAIMNVEHLSIEFTIKNRTQKEKHLSFDPFGIHCFNMTKGFHPMALGISIEELE